MHISYGSILIGSDNSQISLTKQICDCAAIPKALCCIVVLFHSKTETIPVSGMRLCGCLPFPYTYASPPNGLWKHDLPQVTRKIIHKCVSVDGVEREEVSLEGAPQRSISMAEGDGYSKVVKRTVLKSEGDHTEVCVLCIMCVFISIVFQISF